MKKTLAAPRALPQIEEPVLLPMATVSRMVGLGKRTLWQWIRAGQFPSADVRIGARVRRWRRTTIERWIETQTQEGSHAAR